jgi:hypothetical protein
MRRPLAFAGVVAAIMIAPRLTAQDTTAVVAIVPDTTAPPLELDGTRLRPRGSLYDVTVRTDTTEAHVGWHTVWIYDATFAGRPAWEVSERRESHAPFAVRVAGDSVVVGREALQPLRWEAVSGDARFVAAFSNDSVYGGATAPAGRATFTAPAPLPLVTSAGDLDAVLQAAPLAAGWSAGASLLVADMEGARVLPLHLAVTGEETVEVPAGRFDAWVVQATTAGSARTLWVDKRTGLVVRAVEQPPHMPGMIVERVLVGGY